MTWFHSFVLWVDHITVSKTKSSISARKQCPFLQACQRVRGRYHGGRRPSSDDSFHSPTVIPPSALDKPSIMKRYRRWRTCSHTSPRRSPTMVTLHDTRFVECRWWNDGWTVKTVVTWRSSASMIPALGSSYLAFYQPVVSTCEDLMHAKGLCKHGAERQGEPSRQQKHSDLETQRHRPCIMSSDSVNWCHYKNYVYCAIHLFLLIVQAGNNCRTYHAIILYK